ncbi:MAG: PhoH family protein [bacterium]
MDEKRIIIPDTNIFLHDADCIKAFPGEIIKIPLEVIEEIDDQKRRLDDVGRNARMTSRMLDELRVRGNIATGVELENGTVVSVEFGEKNLASLPPSLRMNKEDNRIIATALSIAEKNPDHVCYFVTKDINMRIKANVIGLRSMDYEAGKIELEELYHGFREVEVEKDVMDEFAKNGELKLDLDPPLAPNEMVVLGREDDDDCLYGRMDAEKEKVVPLKYSMDSVIAGIQPRNPEQVFAFEVLMDDNIKLVTLNGRAGTGKTLLALAAGVGKVMEETIYAELLVSRPVIPMGKDLGFLPGDIEAKLAPWMVPIYDNLDLIFSLSSDKKKRKSSVRDITESTSLIRVEPLTYIRGRSMPERFMIIDEAQNLSPHEVKTIITRAGIDTKVVLTGDPYQIDHPYLDLNSNGLNYVVERFKDNSVAGHVTLLKGERSELAELAAELL